MFTEENALRVSANSIAPSSVKLALLIILCKKNITKIKFKTLGLLPECPKYIRYPLEWPNGLSELLEAGVSYFEAAKKKNKFNF